MVEKKLPAHRIDAQGTGIQIAIWANENEKGRRWYVATITRSYKVKGEWKTTSSLALDHIPVAVRLLNEAHAWITANSKATETRTSTA